MTGYCPRAAQAEILAMAKELIDSVPYSVSLRWLFYGLLQQGIYQDKSGYLDLKRLTAKARKSFYNGWTPATLTDDTRQATVRGWGATDEGDFLREVGAMECTLDKWIEQDCYLEIWFEAKAMTGQFAYYTDHITLRPFGGDASIPYKWQIAQFLQWASDYYAKPLVVLYFGDLDEKGLSIPDSAIVDIRAWSADTPFEFIRAGLNPGDPERFAIPENPERPGSYQWEALGDDSARALILEAVGPFVSHGTFEAVEEEERAITDRFQARIAAMG